MLESARLAYNQFLYKKPSFDPAKDFEPIVNLFFNTQALVVNAEFKVKTVDELVALSKAKAGTLSYTAPSLPLATSSRISVKRSGMSTMASWPHGNSQTRHAASALSRSCTPSNGTLG